MRVFFSISSSDNLFKRPCFRPFGNLEAFDGCQCPPIWIRCNAANAGWLYLSFSRDAAV